MASLLEGALAAKIGNAFKGIFMDAVLTREIQTGSAWDPVTGTTQTFTCKAIHEEWSKTYLAGGLVQAGERKVLILSTTLATEPLPGDKITIRGETFTIVPEGEGAPAVETDPAKATWTIRARK